MARISKGVCPKAKNGNRRHNDVVKTDVYGNKFIVCVDCGTCMVETINHNKITIES